jgi:hypothetical protein
MLAACVSHIYGNKYAEYIITLIDGVLVAQKVFLFLILSSCVSNFSNLMSLIANYISICKCARNFIFYFFQYLQKFIKHCYAQIKGNISIHLPINFSYYAHTGQAQCLKSLLFLDLFCNNFFFKFPRLLRQEIRRGYVTFAKILRSSRTRTRVFEQIEVPKASALPTVL